MLVVAGCGQGSSKPTVHLRGMVTINGEPIPGDAQATIMFRPTEKGMAKTAGVPITDSKYECPDVPVGNVAVFFSIQTPTGKMISDAGGPQFPELASIVPEVAHKGIQITITGDSQTQDFNLE